MKFEEIARHYTCLVCECVCLHMKDFWKLGKLLTIFEKGSADKKQWQKLFLPGTLYGTGSMVCDCRNGCWPAH